MVVKCHKNGKVAKTGDLVKEYKVVEVKTRSIFSGAFTGFHLEKMLNKHSKDGWIFDKIANNKSAFFQKNTFMLVFCREI